MAVTICYIAMGQEEPSVWYMSVQPLAKRSSTVAPYA